MSGGGAHLSAVDAVFVIAQIRSLEVDKQELQSDVAAQQQSQNAKTAELNRMRQELSAAQAERHSAVQQV